MYSQQRPETGYITNSSRRGRGYPERPRKLRALPLRKITGRRGRTGHLAGTEYRLMPIKVRQIDRNGKIAGEVVISEIRVSDE